MTENSGITADLSCSESQISNFTSEKISKKYMNVNSWPLSPFKTTNSNGPVMQIVQSLHKKEIRLFENRRWFKLKEERRNLRAGIREVKKIYKAQMGELRKKYAIEIKGIRNIDLIQRPLSVYPNAGGPFKQILRALQEKQSKVVDGIDKRKKLRKERNKIRERVQAERKRYKMQVKELRRRYQAFGRLAVNERTGTQEAQILRGDPDKDKDNMEEAKNQNLNKKDFQASDKLSGKSLEEKKKLELNEILEGITSDKPLSALNDETLGIKNFLENTSDKPLPNKENKRLN